MAKKKKKRRGIINLTLTVDSPLLEIWVRNRGMTTEHQISCQITLKELERASTLSRVKIVKVRPSNWASQVRDRFAEWISTSEITWLEE